MDIEPVLLSAFVPEDVRFLIGHKKRHESLILVHTDEDITQTNDAIVQRLDDIAENRVKLEGKRVEPIFRNL